MTKKERLYSIRIWKKDHEETKLQAAETPLLGEKDNELPSQVEPETMDIIRKTRLEEEQLLKNYKWFYGKLRTSGDGCQKDILEMEELLDLVTHQWNS